MSFNSFKCVVYYYISKFNRTIGFLQSNGQRIIWPTLYKEHFSLIKHRVLAKHSCEIFEFTMKIDVKMYFVEAKSKCHILSQNQSRPDFQNSDRPMLSNIYKFTTTFEAVQNRSPFWGERLASPGDQTWKKFSPVGECKGVSTMNNWHHTPEYP